MYFIFDKFELVMISVQQIKYILAVAKTLNFKKAADICFVSPSTLSNGISEFEKNLGVHIFERDNKKVIITKIGKEIIKRSKAIKAISENRFKEEIIPIKLKDQKISKCKLMILIKLAKSIHKTLRKKYHLA